MHFNSKGLVFAVVTFFMDAQVNVSILAASFLLTLSNLCSEYQIMHCLFGSLEVVPRGYYLL